MDKEKEINNLENQNAYESIDEKLVKFVKAIEFYDDYGKHLLCTENCKECSLKPLCEYRGEQNVNLALHLTDAGYGNIKEYQDEIDRLSTELAHREEDLIHADENVFYREQAVKLGEDKIKQQAVKDFAEELKENLEYIVSRAVDESWGSAYEYINELVKKQFSKGES